MPTLHAAMVLEILYMGCLELEIEVDRGGEVPNCQVLVQKDRYILTPWKQCCGADPQVWCPTTTKD